MPSDYTPPAGRQRPDPERNVTRALADHPDAIIVSLTSNDADLGYTPLEQLERYDAMQAAAGPIPIYFTTTTPRSFWRGNGRGTKAEKRKIQAVLKDSTLARYGDRGNRLLDGPRDGRQHAGPGLQQRRRCPLQRRRPSHLFPARRQLDGSRRCRSPPTMRPGATGLRLRPAPNPSPSTIDVLVGDGLTQLDVFDLRGRHVRELVNGPLTGGQHRVALGELAAGLYLVRLRQGGESETVTLSVAR